MYNSCGSDVVHGVAPTESHTDLAWVVGYRLGIVAVLAIRPIPGMRAGMMEMMELYKECRTRRPSLSPVRPEPDFAAAGHPGAIAIAGRPARVPCPLHMVKPHQSPAGPRGSCPP